MALLRRPNERITGGSLARPFSTAPPPPPPPPTDLSRFQTRLGLPITVTGGVGGVEFDIPIPGTGGIPGTISIGSGEELGDPGIPGINTFQPVEGGCFPGWTPDPITGECRFDFDPGAGTGFPGGGAAAGTGLNRPSQISRSVLVCPKFADGKTGILWMNALTGDVVCLPRRTSGRGFGLIRKNPPRKPAFISAAAKADLAKMKKTQEKAKKFASDAGFTCKKK